MYFVKNLLFTISTDSNLNRRVKFLSSILLHHSKFCIFWFFYLTLISFLTENLLWRKRRLIHPSHFFITITPHTATTDFVHHGRHGFSSSAGCSWHFFTTNESGFCIGGLLYWWWWLTSIGSGLTADVLQLDADEDADAFDGVRVGIGTKSGKGDGVVDAPVGRTNAISPFGSRVGTKCTLVPLELLNRIPFGCTTGCVSISNAGFGRICTWTTWSVCCCWSRAWFKQFAKCCKRRRFTTGSKPGKRPTSLAHSLKPARNLPITDGSVAVVMTACWRWRFCRCLTVISRMSAFSSLECLAGCNKDALIRCEVAATRDKRLWWLEYGNVGEVGREGRSS